MSHTQLIYVSIVNVVLFAKNSIGGLTLPWHFASLFSTMVEYFIILKCPSLLEWYSSNNLIEKVPYVKGKSLSDSVNLTGQK